METSSPKPKMAYVGHIFHTKTGSTDFFRQILREKFEVTEYAIDPWKGEKTVPVETLNGYEYVVFFQRISPVGDLRKLRAKIIFVQMYDSANFDYFYWKNLAFLPMKVIAFSKKVEVQCRKFDVGALQVKYYLDPKKYRVEFQPTGRHVFFWYRGALPWKTVRIILNPAQIDSFTYLSNPDPGYLKETIDPDDIRRFKMKIIESQFMPTHEEYLRLLSQANIFIAPRLKEGIGISMLEALAMGSCVIANDEATMNEYIGNKKNGYLFDADNPKTIDLTDFETIRRNSLKDARDGYAFWLENYRMINEFILDDFKSAKDSPVEEKIFNTLYNLKLKIFSLRQKLPRIFRL